MGFFIFLFLLFLAFGIACNESTVSSKVRCTSSTCSYNRGGRCSKGVITVYDNTIKGLCLDHTEDMNKRIIEPMTKKGMKVHIVINSSRETPEVSKVLTSRKYRRDWGAN